MRIQCPQCGAGGNIPDEKIPAQGRKIVCPKCKASFSVSAPKTAALHNASHNASQSSAQESYQHGIQYLKTNQIDAAIEQFTRALRIDPQYHQIYRPLGLAYGQKGLWQEATQALQKAISNKPDDVLALKNLGVAYLRQKHYDKAEEVLRQAVRYAPEDQKIKAVLAKALQQKTQHTPPRPPGVPAGNEASEDAGGTHSAELPPSSPPEELILATPANPVQHLLDQGVTCLDNAQYNKAIEAFQEVTRVAPNNSDGYYGLGLVHEKRKEWDKALSAYQKAVELNPDDSTVKESLRFVKKQKRKAKFSWWKRKAE